MIWLLVGVFIAPYNSHEVFYTFENQRDCEVVRKMLTGEGITFTGFKPTSATCIQITKVEK